MADPDAPYAEYAAQLAPAWLRSALGGGYLYAVGLVLDGQVEAAYQAVAARFLRTAPQDALPLAADERQLPRPAGATSAGWRSHLQQAWNLWRKAGTREGLEAAFGHLGLTATVYTERDWPLDGRWSDFRVVVTGHPWQTDGVWGDPGTWGDGGTWGSTASEGEIAQVYRAVRLWRPAEGWCRGVVIAWSGDPTDEMDPGPSMTWRPKD